MATDTDWARIQERARAARRNVSEYVVDRLTAPQPEPVIDPAQLDRRLRRVERLVQALYEVEAHRLRQHGDEKTLDRLLRQADAAIEREDALG